MLPGPVVYLSEEGLPGLAYKTQEARPHRQPLLLPRRVLPTFRGLDFAARVDLAGSMAADVGTGTVFIDTLSAIAGIRGEDENTAGVALELIAHLDHLKQAGLAVVCVQHQRKSAGALAESGRGSSAIAGGFDFLIGLERPRGGGHERRRTLSVEGRIDVPPTVVIDLGEDARFHYVGDVKDAARSDARRMILEMTRGVGRDKALAEKEIVAAASEAGIGRTCVREALQELVADGSLLRDMGVNGLRKNAYGYWSSGSEA